MTGRNFPLHLAARRAGSLALACVLALGLTACDEAKNDAEDNTPNTSGPTTSATPAPGGTTAPSQTPDAGETAGAVGVYFVGTAPTGPRLFREFHKVKGDRATEAAKLVDGGGALDPDYRTLWPGQTVEKVTVDDSSITVALNGDAFTEAPDGMDEPEAQLAIQQMVYTLQAVAGDRLPVTFVRSEGPKRLFGVDVSKPIAEALWNDVLAHVSLTDVSVSGTTLTASGVASAFEATVVWSILSGDEEVLKGHASAEGWMDKLYPWTAEVDVSALEPGEYIFVARDFEHAAGEEGNAPTEDTKTFTVR